MWNLLFTQTDTYIGKFNCLKFASLHIDNPFSHIFTCDWPFSHVNSNLNTWKENSVLCGLHLYSSVIAFVSYVETKHGAGNHLLLHVWIQRFHSSEAFFPHSDENIHMVNLQLYRWMHIWIRIAMCGKNKTWHNQSCETWFYKELVGTWFHMWARRFQQWLAFFTHELNIST